MEKLPTAIEELAVMINTPMASTEDIKSLEGRVNLRFDAVTSWLGKIEHLLPAEQKREIEDLKQRTTRLKDALAV
jgi:hypothetical protein